MKLTAIGDNRDTMKYLGRSDDGEFYATLDGGATWQQVSKPGADGAKGEKGDRGFSGITYTPAIDADGWLTWTNDGGVTNPEPVKLALASTQVGMKVFSNIASSQSGYQRAVLYAQGNGVPGECVSAQHPDTTWGVYQIQDNRTLELVGWYHTSFHFTSEDLDEDGNLSVDIGSFPIAVKGGGEVIPVCPSEENTENNIYRLNLNGLIVPGVSYTIVTVKE